METICVIPLRSGSTRILRKNFIKIMGVPLYQYSLIAAVNSKIFDRIIIGVDDISMIDREFCRSNGVTVYLRDSQNSTSHATADSFLTEIVDAFNLSDTDWLVLLQATNPFHRMKYFIELIGKIKAAKSKSIFSTVRSKRFTLNEVINPNFKRERTQDRIGQVLETGLFWAVRVDACRINKLRLNQNFDTVEIDSVDDFDIDYQIDLQIFTVKMLWAVDSDKWWSQNIYSLSKYNQLSSELHGSSKGMFAIKDIT